MNVNNTKYPCRNCKYYNACGDSKRIEPCKGRQTKTEQKVNQATAK